MADNNANEYSTVTLSLDDGTECECAIVRIFPAGDNNYIALLPLEGEPVLENIESDEEYETVADAFDEELDAMEYEELYAEEDDENEE